MKNSIEKLLAEIPPSQVKKGEKLLLESDDVVSVKYWYDEGVNIFEAMIAYRGGILMPYLMTGEDDVLVCQCEQEDTLCVHKIAVLLAAQVMLEADCSDYHMALKIKTAQAMERILHLFPKS